jgi:hypothetical protein
MLRDVLKQEIPIDEVSRQIVKTLITHRGYNYCITCLVFRERMERPTAARLKLFNGFRITWAWGHRILIRLSRCL